MLTTPPPSPAPPSFPRSSALTLARGAAPGIAGAQCPGGPGGRPHPGSPGSPGGGGAVGPGDRGPAAADGGRPQCAVRAAGECWGRGRRQVGLPAREGAAGGPRQMCGSCCPARRGRAGDRQVGGAAGPRTCRRARTAAGTGRARAGAASSAAARPGPAAAGTEGGARRSGSYIPGYL